MLNELTFSCDSIVPYLCKKMQHKDSVQLPTKYGIKTILDNKSTGVIPCSSFFLHLWANHTQILH